jgi:hypothetical protein
LRPRGDGIIRGHNCSARLVQPYLLRLQESGVPLAAISAQTGAGLRTLRYIAAGKRRYVRWYTAERILGTPLKSSVPGHRRNADRSRRMVRELKRLGMSNKAIATEVGVTDATRIARQRFVQPKTERRLEVACLLLARRGLVPADVLEEVSA